MKNSFHAKNNPFVVTVNRIIRKKKSKDAKHLKSNLKNLKNNIATKTNTSDKDLEKLGNIIRQTPDSQPSSTMDGSSCQVTSSCNSTTPANICGISTHELIEKYSAIEKFTDDALKKLETWSCDK